ncbi:hypothetical protein [Streptomyces phaeochromogenes]
MVVPPAEAPEARQTASALLDPSPLAAPPLEAALRAAALATPTPSPTRPRIPRTVLGLLLATLLLAAAHQGRPDAPYGDHFVAHARVEHAHGTPPRPVTRGATVEAYDERTGELRWTYGREGRRPLAVLPARGDAITLWDDGLVTATSQGAVRWHRAALPGAADWLAAHGGAGVLRNLDRGMLAVVTPRRVTAYRVEDGDLRWVVPARRGCVFAPARAVRRGAVLLVAQPCPGRDWTAQLIAVDDLGRITPHRTPLGNERHTSEHPHAEKMVARPR